MARTRRRRILVTAGALLVIALVATGCGGRLGGSADGGLAAGGSVPPSATAAPAVAPTDATPTTASQGPTPAPPTAAPPTADSAAMTPEPAPLATPDLSAIDQLLRELDAALGADATADTDEGSAP